MKRCIHSPSLKASLVARVLARWQACSSTVRDGGNAGEEVLRAGICEVFFGCERSACIPTQIRKSCTWSFVVYTRNLLSAEESGIVTRHPAHYQTYDIDGFTMHQTHLHSGSVIVPMPRLDHQATTTPGSKSCSYI
ncbi:hypothetical protein AVEN_227127-1 [Araneus ventricosus]|uniref:Uncharacterized protein n=1 Tax=Araneus ventricosus TaxID=182803 RepID=A0A4Y2BX53_ARAVE|nr:hypothetical protein AVEN_227127-1 [Araneus ventricosus]